jgi:hypothetical protein
MWKRKRKEEWKVKGLSTWGEGKGIKPKKGLTVS